MDGMLICRRIGQDVDVIARSVRRVRLCLEKGLRVCCIQCAGKEGPLPPIFVTPGQLREVREWYTERN